MAADSGKVAELVPWRDHVSVGSCPWTGAHWICHEVTGERVELPLAIDAQLVFDEDGEGCVIFRRQGEAGVEEEVIVIDDLLSELLYKTPGGELLVVRSDVESPESLSDAQARARMVKIVVECGAQRLHCSLSGAVMERVGFYSSVVRFSLHDLYTALGLSSFQGQRWSWTSANWPGWHKFLQAALPEHEQALQKAMPREGDSAFEEKAHLGLQWPSASTPALMLLLARSWASTAPQSGRLVEARAVRAAEELFCAMVDVLLGESWDLNLLVSQTVKLSWPQPPTGAHPVSLEVSQDLVVNFGALSRAFDKPRDACVVFLQALGAQNPKGMHIVQLVEELVRWRPRCAAARYSLLGQVCLRLAERIDMRILKAVETPIDQQRGALKVVIVVCVWGGRLQMCELHKHVPCELSAGASHDGCE